jgi:tetraacyldisaccharide 4'-kinase
VPTWWSGKAGVTGGIASVLTLPLEGVFRVGSGLRNRLYDRRILAVERVPVPVVSVGNLTLGGTGKTPIAAWIANALRERGKKPWILLRGYGMDEVEVHRELNPEVPIATGKARAEAARGAIAEGADCLILDDGFQHRRLRRDLDIVLVSAEQWRERPRLLPRGPWREPLSALDRASLVVVTRKSAGRAAAEALLTGIGRYAPQRPAVLAHLVITSLEPLDPKDEGAPFRPGDELTAVTSLGTPEAFEEQLRSMGAAVRPVRFRDHHDFTSSNVQAILRRAGGSRIVMTRKEAVKLRGRFPSGVGALVATQGIVIERGEQELLEALREAVP